jgi:hypothetical protein
VIKLVIKLETIYVLKVAAEYINTDFTGFGYTLLLFAGVPILFTGVPL